MKTETRVWTLDELILANKVKLGRGNIISKKDIASFPGEYPIYSSAREKNGTFGFYGKYMFDEELITWSIDGGGRLFYRPRHKFSVTNVGGTLRILDTDFLNCRYLHLVLTHLHSKIRFDWVYKAHPSVIRMVYNEIPIPSLEKQREIVEKLDRAFAEIDQLEASIQLEIESISDLFQSLIDSKFDSLAGFSQPHRLEEFCTKIQDGSHFSPKVQLTEPKDGWFPYLTSKNVRNNYVDLKGVTYIDSDFHGGIFQRCNPEFGDLLLTKDGVNTGNVTVNTLDFPFSLLSSVCIIKVKKEQLDATYLKFYLQSSKGNRNILGDMTGAAIKRIILGTIKNLLIPIVDIKTQRGIGVLLESNLLSVNEYKSGLAKKISLVKSLRQSLLSSAFTPEEAVA